MSTTALLIEEEAAKYLQVSRSYLRIGRMHGTGPRYSKLGRSVRYTLSDLDAWVEANARWNTLQLKKEA
jgi:excisionase family DNA binding protein